VRCGREQYRVSKRFSELSKIHKQLKAAWANESDSPADGADGGNGNSSSGCDGGGGGGGDTSLVVIPKFPSKRRAAGAHLIRPGQVAERVAELQEYFDELLASPQVLAKPVFCDALGITEAAATDESASRLRQLLDQLGHLALAEERRNSALHMRRTAGNVLSPLLSRRGKGGNQRYRQQQAADSDFLYSQRFHRLAKVVSARGASAPTSTDQRQLLRESNSDQQQQQQMVGNGVLGEDDDAAPIPALYFTHPLRFVLRCGFWGCDDKSVREAPGARTWFSLLGPVPSVAVGKHPRQSDYFALVNASTAAVPLIFLSAVVQQQPQFAIWEAMSDGTVGARLCTIGCSGRNPATGATEYSMLANSGDGKHDLSCEGVWPSDFRFHQSGASGPSAVVSVRSPRDSHFSVEIAAHRDIIFYLAVAIAIDKLESLALKQSQQSTTAPSTTAAAVVSSSVSSPTP